MPLIFSNERDTYSILTILHHPLTETPGERGIRDSGISLYCLMASASSSKDSKLFANLSDSLSASALLKGNNVLRNNGRCRD